MGRFSTKKKKKKCKDDQNGPIHPENSRLKFFIIGGSGKIFGLILFKFKFYFISMVISFKIWQIIIFSSKFSLNWAISSVFIFYFIFH